MTKMCKGIQSDDSIHVRLHLGSTAPLPYVPDDHSVENGEDGQAVTSDVRPSDIVANVERRDEESSEIGAVGYTKNNNVVTTVHDVSSRVTSDTQTVVANVERREKEPSEIGAVGYTKNNHVVTTALCVRSRVTSDTQRQLRESGLRCIPKITSNNVFPVNERTTNNIGENASHDAYQDIHPGRELKKLHDHHHAIRTKSKDDPFGSGHVHKKYDAEEKEFVKEKMAPYIGQIFVENIFAGSCLLIGNQETACALMCYHEIQRVMKKKGESGLQEVSVAVAGHKYKVINELKKVDILLDYAILKLVISSGVALPKTWSRFGPVPEKDFQIYILGYQGDDLHIDDSAIVLNHNPYNRVHTAKTLATHNYSKLLNKGKTQLEKGKILVQSIMQNGASGGIGVYKNEHGDLVVILMYQEGHPLEYYQSLGAQKLSFTSEQLVEQGIAMMEIYRDIKEKECSITRDDSMGQDVLFGNLDTQAHLPII